LEITIFYLWLQTECGAGLMEGDPRWAGYCSVLVNVNDIAAMGGVPMGMTNVIFSKIYRNM